MNVSVFEAPCSSTFGKRGKILHAQAREIVANVIKFMEKEAESIKTKGEPLIPFDNYKQRVRMATGISEKLYKTIRKEAKQVEAGEAPCFSTPQHFKRKRKLVGIEQMYSSYGNIVYDCPQCSYQSASILQLDHHIQMKHVRAATLFDAIAELQQFSCICCDYKSQYQFELYEHFKLTHNLTSNETDENLPVWQEFERYPCEHCSYESDSSLALVKHRVSCEKKASKELHLPDLKWTDARAVTQSGHGSKLKCNLCSYRTNQMSQLNGHMLRHATNSERITTWLRCNHCSYRVERMSHLKRHVLVSHAAAYEEIRRFQCNDCSYRATQKSQLKRHALRYHVPPESRPLCNHCSYRAVAYRDLKRHNMLKHTPRNEVVWFRCMHCSYRTKEKAQLKSHMLRHLVPPHLTKKDEIDWF